jgi:hypothetical protein
MLPSGLSTQQLDYYLDGVVTIHFGIWYMLPSGLSTHTTRLYIIFGVVTIHFGRTDTASKKRVHVTFFRKKMHAALWAWATHKVQLRHQMTDGQATLANLVCQHHTSTTLHSKAWARDAWTHLACPTHALPVCKHNRAAQSSPKGTSRWTTFLARTASTSIPSAKTKYATSRVMRALSKHGKLPFMSMAVGQTMTLNTDR